jgi:hypothetical protein
LRYFLFPRRAAAYRIGKLIASTAEGTPAAPGASEQAMMNMGEFLGAVISEATKAEEPASVPGAARPAAMRSQSHVQQVAKKLRKVKESDPKLFALVMEELNKRAV